MISIIVPCYKQAQYLSETLDSVIAQTCQNWECIIVNDGSPDNTEEIALKYCNTDKRFKYLMQKNSGVAAARNNGILNSIGKYILPLDADDIIHPEYLSEASTILEQNKKIKWVYANAKLFGEENGSWDLPKYTLKKLALVSILYCSGLYRRCDYDKSGGYSANMAEGLEDWDFSLSILKYGGEVYKIPKTYFFYRIKKKSRAKGLDMKNYSLLRKKVYKHHEQFYDDTFGDPVTLLNIIEERECEIKKLNDELRLIRNSKWWKLRKLITKKLEQ